jgi:hypothetical protein
MGLILGKNGICGWCLWMVLDSLPRYRTFHTVNKGKRKTSHSQNSDAAKRRSIVGSASGEVAAPWPPSPPPKHTTWGRQIKLPEEFK